MLVHFLYIGAREQTCQMRLQCQWSPAAVMNASSFPVHIHLCLTRVEIIRWTGGILSWTCSILFITALNNILKHEGDILHICDHNVMWFEWLSVTGMEQCTFHWSISSELLQEQRVFNGLITHHLIMITCISYGNISAIFVPKCINIAPL